MRSGIEWPIPRFEERQDVIIDRLSGLMWARDAALTKFPQTWREALDFIAAMNNEASFGYQDWHLPERWELFSLISHACINPSLPYDAPFENVFSGYYWTATTCSRLENQAWYIHLGGGRIYRGMKYGSYMVWPVRCHSNDQTSASNGGRRLGSSLNNHSVHGDRYVLGNHMVYDRLTGLVWSLMDVRSSGLLGWTAALDLIRELNAANLGEHAGWHLPNIRELESLIDLQRHTPALSEAFCFDRIPEVHGCWSSTTSVYEPRYAWVVYLQDGAVGVGHKKKAEFHAWAVREGNARCKN